GDVRKTQIPRFARDDTVLTALRDDNCRQGTWNDKYFYATLGVKRNVSGSPHSRLRSSWLVKQFWRSLEFLDRVSAIHNDHLPCDVGRLFGSEERYGGCDFLRSAGPPHPCIFPGSNLFVAG